MFVSARVLSLASSPPRQELRRSSKEAASARGDEVGHLDSLNSKEAREEVKEVKELKELAERLDPSDPTWGPTWGRTCRKLW